MMKKTALPAGIRSLVARIENSRDLGPAMARDLLEESAVTPSDLEPWTDFGHPKASSYGRKRIWDGGFFELRVMSWVDGDMSAVHDHGPREWGAVRLWGRAEYAVFGHENGLVSTRDRRVSPPGSVIALAPGLVHQMGNVGQEPFLTLHLHGGRERRSGGAGMTRLYDFDQSEIQVTERGAFFDLPDSEVAERVDGPEADFPTYMRHQAELLKRAMVRDEVVAKRRFQSPRQERLAAELFAATTWRRLADEWNGMSAGPSLRLEHYSRVLYTELKVIAALQKLLIDAGLAEPVFDAVRLAELLAFSYLDRFADGYLDLVGDTYSLSFSSLAAA